MTNDFKRLAGQLAMGINFDENAVVMATQIDRGNQKAEVNFYANGERLHVRTLIIEIIKQYLSNFDGEEASFECGALMTAFTRVDKKENNVHSNDNKNIPIEDCVFTVRTHNCLKRAGINILGDIKSVEQLKNVRNLGKRSAQEVVDKLKEYGIELPDSEVQDNG